MLEAGGPFAKALREKAREAALAVADYEQASDQAGGDRKPHDESRDKSLRDAGAEADQATDHEQAHQHEEIQRALAEDRAQRLRAGDVGLLSQQVGAVEVAHLRGEDAVGEPGEDDDVEQPAEPVGFSRVTQQDLPADGADDEGEVEGSERQRVEDQVRLADRPKARTVIQLDMGQHDKEDDGQDHEGNQGARIEEPLAKRGPRGRRLRRNGRRLHLGFQHIRDRPAGISLFGDLAAAEDPLE